MSADKKMQTVTPYLMVDGAAEAMAFYSTVFGATEDMRLKRPDGKIMHAQMNIGNSIIMIADGAPGDAPADWIKVPLSLYILVDDVDAVFRKAKALNATVNREPQDEFYGSRVAIFTDPFGHMWSVATPKERVSLEEMEKRGAELYNK